MRRAVAGNRSANDTAKTRERETDISAKKVKETQRAKEKPTLTDDHVVVNYFPMDRVHSPQTNNHEMAQC